MKYRRGEVVMVDHPFSDARGSKVRPMLIVQSGVQLNRISVDVNQPGWAWGSFRSQVDFALPQFFLQCRLALVGCL
jgi:hypothetical protein